MKIKKSRQKKLSASNPSAQNQQANDISPMEEQKLVDQVVVASGSAKPSEQAVESEDDNFAQRKLVEAEEEKEPSEQAVLASKSSALTSSEVTTIKELTNAEAAKALSVDGDSLMTEALAEESAGSEGAGSLAPAATSAVTMESFGKQHPNESGVGILALLAAGGAIAVAAAGGGGGGSPIAATPLSVTGPTVLGVQASTVGSNVVWALNPPSGANNIVNGGEFGLTPSSDANNKNYYNAGDVMTFKVTMSEAVTVNGMPQLTINIGTTKVQAQYASGSGSANLYFTYAVLAGQNDDNGVSIDANSLSLNGGSIVSTNANNGVPAGTAASLTHGAVLDNPNYIVDTKPTALATLGFEPLAAAVVAADTNHILVAGYISGEQAQGLPTTVSPDGTFSIADQIDPNQGAITMVAEKDSLVTLDFSRIASDGITLSTITKIVVGTGVSQAIELTSADLIALGSGNVSILGYDIIQAKVTRIVDLAGNSLLINNDNVFINNANSGVNGAIRFKLDTTVPTVTVSDSLGTVTLNGEQVPITAFNPVTLNPGQEPTITYTYKFSEAVTGLTVADFVVTQTASDGTTIIPISLDASMLKNPSGDYKTYTLTVKPAPVNYQTDTDTLTVFLKGFSVIDAAGNPLHSVGANSDPFVLYTTQTTKTIDTIAPVARAVAVASGSGVKNSNWYNAGDVLTVMLTMDEAVKVTGTPQLAINMDGFIDNRYGLIGLPTAEPKKVNALYAGQVAGRPDQLLFTYTIQAGENTDNGVRIDAGALSLNGGSISDIAGNALNLAGNAQFPAASVVATDNGNFKIDTRIPATPPTLALALDSGFSATDGLTNNATINVTGLESQPIAATWMYQVDGGSSWATGTGASFTARSGTHSYRVVQVDEAGNTSEASAVSVYTLDTTVPTVSSVALTTFTDNDPLSPATPKVLGVGDVVTATVTMSEAVTVTGTPQLALLVGSTTRAASYVAGSGTNSLTFTYVVVASDTDSDGISIAAGSLTLPGGSMTDLAGNTATVSFGAVADNANFKVDTVISTPTLALASDTGTSQVDGISTNPTISITGLEQGATWQYAVDGVWTTVNAIDSNGGNTFTFLASAGRHSYSARQVDAAGNVGTAVSRSLLIDHVMPTVSSIALSGGGGANLLIAGSVVTATVTMSEEVTVTGTPQLGLTIGNSVYFASYSSGTGSQNLIFTYAILSGQVDSNGISVGVNSLHLNNGVITDLAGNNAVLLQSFSLPDDGNFRVDAVLPTVAGIALTTSTDNLPLSTATPKVLSVGDVVTATVTMSETVTVTGTPQLALLVGSTTRAASYVAGSGTNSLTFTYVIVAGDTDSNGISVAANALSLNGGTIVDTATNAASLVTAIVVADNPSFKVDTTAPTTPSLALASDTGTSSSDGVTSNPTINVTGLEQGATWQYALDGGSWITVDPITSNGGATFSFVASAGSHIYTMRQADTAGNLSVTSTALSVTFDNIPPTLSNTNAPIFALTGGGNSAGDTIVLTITFDEAVNGLTSGTDNTIFQVAGTGVSATWSGTAGATTRTLTYTVASQNGQATINEAALKTALIAGISDLAGNAFAYTANSGNIANIDSTPLPVIDTTMPAAPTLTLGTGVAGGATAAEATAAGGVVTVTAEAGSSVAVTFSRTGGGTVTKAVTGNGASAVAVALSAADLTTLGDGSISVSAVATDFAGNPSPAGTTTFMLDTVAPTAPALTLGTGIANGATSAEATAAGGAVTVTAEASSSVAVTFSRSGGGTVTKTVTGNGATAVPVVLSAAELTTLGDGNISVSAVATDGAGNASVAGTTSFALDTTLPSVSGVAISGATGAMNGFLNVGDVVTVTATMSEVVTVTGTPTLGINIGGGTPKQASFAAGSGTNSLVFTYVIAATDTDSNGISIDAGSLGLTGSAAITDLAGNAVTPAFTATAADNAHYKVDTTAPTAATFSPADAATGVAANDSLRLTFSELMEWHDGVITIWKDEATDVKFLELTIANGVVTPTVGSGSATLATIGGVSTLTIGHVTAFATSGAYYVQVGNALLTDLAGNAWAGIADMTTWNFTVL